MQALVAPSVAARQLYRSVSSRRANQARNLLVAAEQEVFAAYDEYDRAAPTDVTTLRARTFTAPEATALKTNYDRLRRVSKETRDQLLIGAVRGTCPMCAERTASTLDHYLPRSQFPEFAVLPLNLVPVCWECNHAKRGAFAENGEAVYLHAYFDRLRDHLCLHADVDVSSGVALLDFRIQCPASMPGLLERRLRAHCQALRLMDLYRFKGEEEASIQALQVGQMISDGATPDEVRRFLLSGRDAAAAVLGANHWRPATYTALAASKEFCSGSCA